MKRSALLAHLHPLLNKRSAVPRHNEVLDNLARKICKDLGIPFVK